MSTRLIERWIVELERGCWLAPWTGDPGRTLVLSSARTFPSRKRAERAIDLARDYRPFTKAHAILLDPKLSTRDTDRPTTRNINMRIITDPVRVTLIARTRIEWANLADLMAERGLEWKHADAEGEPRCAYTDIGEKAFPLHVQGTEGSLLAEYAGRGCYNSFSGPNGAGMGRASNRDHVKHLIEVEHGSVLEHVTFTFQIHNSSRGLSHELVRHRVGTAFSQASTRFRDESAGAFVVPPLVRKEYMGSPGVRTALAAIVLRTVNESTRGYDAMLNRLKDSTLLKSSGLKGTAARKAARGIARSLLPIGLESPIVLTVNARAARNILDQRATVHAEAEIREMAVAMWRILVKEEPALFDDYELHAAQDGTEYLTTQHTKV